MPRLLAFAWVSVFLLGVPSTAEESVASRTRPEAGRVFLVGVDGASWSVIDPLLAGGRLPNLAALAARGVTAELETVEPVISPTVWSSIATGRRPEAHQVTDFMKDARDLDAPTIFERLAVQGLRVGTFDYLLTWPPQALPAGFVIPGWLRRDDATEPRDALKRAGGPGYRYRLRGTAGREAYAALTREEVRLKASQWNALARTFELDAGAVSFYSVDAVSHRFWHDAFPEQFDPDDVPKPEPRYAGLLEEVLVGVDRALGEIAAELSPEDVLIVVSDHGFQARDGYRRVWDGHIEPALHRAGLDPGAQAFTIEGEFAYIVLRVHSGPFAERDALLDRLVAFFESAQTLEGEALFRVEILDVVERPAHARRPLAARAWQWLLIRAMQWIFSTELDPDAHAYLLMRPRDPRLESAWETGEIQLAGQRIPMRDFIRADGFTGEHNPTAVLLAAGGPIRHVPQRGQLSVLDVAPLFAYLAGVAIPDDLEGRLPEQWLDADALAARPPRRVDADSLRRLPAPVAPDSADGESDVIERLRSMGYVE